MFTILTFLRLFVYIIANATSFPALIIVFRNKLLHENFRIILAVIIFSGYILSCVTYLNLAVIMLDVHEELTARVQRLVRTAEILLYYGATLFVYGNLCLTIERCLAVCFVKSYEKYSSSLISALVTILAVTLPAAAYACIVTNLPPDHVLTITCFFICSLASAIISAYLRFIAPAHVANSGNTLRSKYQTKENSRTMIIYFSLSLNELLTGVMMVILIYFIYRNDEVVEIKSTGYAAEMLDLVTAYRVLVINVALIYYWSKEKQARKVKNITSHNAEDHFKAMKEMWK